MPNYFTKQGFSLHQQRIRVQEIKVKKTGKETGEAAGPSCDWHDNFAYEEAKRSFEMESRLLDRMIGETKAGVVIDVQEQSDKVKIGVTVKIKMSDQEREFTIGGFGESMPNQRLITYISPLGQALVDMKVGDLKPAVMGGKDVQIEILEILPPSHRYNDLISNILNENTAEN